MLGIFGGMGEEVMKKMEVFGRFFSATHLWPPEPKWNCEERF